MKMRVLLLLPFIGIATMARAQDKYGGEFRFARISDLTYSVEFRLCNNPNGQSSPPYVTIDLGDGNSEMVNASSTLIVNGSCSNIELKTFITQHTYPGPGSYSLTVQTGDRVPNIANIPGSVNVPRCVPGLRVVGGCGSEDSSPIFMN